MVSSLFIERVRCRTYSAIGSTDKPRLRCKLLTEWKPGFYFFSGTEVTPTALSGATLTFELKNKATSAVLLRTTTFTTADDGHHADFASVDSPALRTLLGEEVSVVVTGEIEWVISGRALRATVDVLVENAFVRPDDVAPDPVAEASETWLDERAVRWDKVQELTNEEKARARANIGVGEGGGATDHGALTGLDDHDHPQYALDDAMTTALAGKAATSHTHAQSDVTGLVAALAGKAATSHTHTQSDVTGLETALAGKEAAQTAASQVEAEAGTESAIRKFSPLRIAQAIAALAPSGADGKSAYEVAVDNGFVGDEAAWLASLVGATGLVGADGLSAYAVAVANGFVGDQTAWLASLVGVNGTDGVGVPVGGETGQALVKASNTDLDVVWGTPSTQRFESIVIVCSSMTTPLTTGTAKVTFRMPFEMSILELKASVSVAPTGANIVVDINAGGVSLLDTKLIIDAGTKTSRDSTTSHTYPGGSAELLLDDQEIVIDVDQVGSATPGTGLTVTITGQVI